MHQIFMDVIDEALLLSRCSGPSELLAQQLREADHRVQGRAQLVAHAGQEFALQLVGTLYFAIPQFQLAYTRYCFLPRIAGQSSARSSLAGVADHLP